MNRGSIELAALSAPDDAWILVQATSSMDAYEFGKTSGPKNTITTKKKAADCIKCCEEKSRLTLSTKSLYTVGFYQNVPTKEAGK
jgi:hypothetical protein